MSKKSKAMEFVDEGYSLTVIGRNVQITDAIRDYAIEKISKIERFSNRIIEVHITLDIQRIEHRAEIVIKMDNIKISAHAVTEDLYASIDKVVDKIQAQVRKFKNKMNDYNTRRRVISNMKVTVVSPQNGEELAEINSDIEAENAIDLEKEFKPHTIVRQEVRPLKTLTYDECVMKMELNDDAFLVFRSEYDQKLKVIYRTRDGNYGIISPEE